jgi:dienelactone hydrolase
MESGIGARMQFPSAQILCGVVVLLAHAVATEGAADPPVYADKSSLLTYPDAAGKLQPIRSTADCVKRRADIIANMQLVMGALPAASRRIPLDVKISETVSTPRFVRKRLTYQAEKGDRVPAFLMLPIGEKKKYPAVLCLHQTTRIGKDEPAGLGGSSNLHYAAELAERGYVTLAPDYPSFGEYSYDFATNSCASGSMKAIWNNMRAIDLLQALPQVDGTRIGCIGHSLGGHNAVFTAAFDERIAAIVSNCGFTSFGKYYGGNLKGWSSQRYMPRIASLYHSNPQKMPFDFSGVVAAIAPRAFLAIAPLHDDNFEVSGVRDVIAAARPVYELLGAGEKIAARYPDCRHDFPPEERRFAYRWLDRWLHRIE